MNYVENSWPENKNNLSSEVKVFYKLKHQLYVKDNILFFDNKIVVPKSLRMNMLKLIHEGHFGIEKSKSLARGIFYWPGLATELEKFISSCKICEKYMRKNPKEKLLQFPIPVRVGADIFTFGGSSYFVMFDAYSNWLELIKIKDKSAETIVGQMRSIFARYGSPDIVIADNVPFNSAIVQKFAAEWNFSVVFRSPYYPRANGLAEKGVSISKNIVKKAMEERRDIESSLLNYKNMPLKQINYSPSQLMYSHRCKTKTPISVELLRPELCVNVKERIQAKINLNKSFYDAHARDL